MSLGHLQAGSRYKALISAMMSSRVHQHCRLRREEVEGARPSDLSTFLADILSGEQAVSQRTHQVKNLPRPDSRRAASTSTFDSRHRTTQQGHHSIMCQREEERDR